MNTNEIDTFKGSPVKRALIAYPGTKDGDVSVEILSKQLTAVGIQCYRVEFNQGLDANSYALSHSPASKSLGDVIRKAVWMGADKPHVDLSLDKSIDDNNESIVINSDLDLNQQDESNEIPTSIMARDDEKDNDTSIPATVLPIPAVDVEAEIKNNIIIMCFDNCRYRIRGLENNTVANQLKINLLVNLENALHMDTFDLYVARHRKNFIQQASIELGVSENKIKKHLNKIFLKLEFLQEESIQKMMEPKPRDNELTLLERAEAMHYLTSHNIVHRILEDFQRCGLIGEKTNKLVAYFACISRLLPNPIAVMIQSSSASGKSVLMDVALSFVPVHQRVQYSAITGQSLYYMGDISVKHKIFSVSEEEGVSAAAYALKLLISEGQLTIASTGKDPDSGRHVTREYKVEGPVMLFSTTTAIDIDEELLNRCFVLSVDEDREQTRAIHDLQRSAETLEGLKVNQIKDDVIRVQQNAQSLLKPLRVVNPYAKQLTFLSDKTRARRDHPKYLTLINSIALLHQYQREIKKEYCNGKFISYVEVTIEDIDLANQLAHKVLGSSLDELPPQTRRLLMLIDNMVNAHGEDTNIPRSDYRFSRRDVRAYTGWGDTQLKVHIKRLENMEYLLIHRGGRGRQFIYELLYNSEGQNGDQFLMGLIDVTKLKEHDDDEKLSGLMTHRSGASRPQVGEISGASQLDENHEDAHEHRASETNNLLSDIEVKSLIEKNTQQASYHNSSSSNLSGGAK
ncbi:DNA primase, phage associated [hydrothermal vent metagenome]|uniref:DNA primase, phage associated n=1 Tax=hydrothermal vent metagenome TaxID=652676 RepID=A0A3B0Y4Z4_9ZZZZ